jgi:hypothetical protein
MSLLLGAALLALVLLGVSATTSSGDVAQRVVDVPTRPGVTQRFLLLSPREPKATVVLFAGDDGGLQIAADGRFQNANLVGNFLVRSRQLFVEHDLAGRSSTPRRTGRAFRFGFCRGFVRRPRMPPTSRRSSPGYASTSRRPCG